MALHVQETYVDKDKNAIFGDSEVYETRYEKLGDLYRAMVRQYGRCTGHVYVDTPEGDGKAVGWVFVGRDKYEDDPSKTYLREVWVTVHERKPERTVRHFYVDIAKKGEIAR